MSKVGRPKTKLSKRTRVHFIPEWAAARDLIQARLAEETDINEGTVSRWWSGGVPIPEHQIKLAALFQTSIHGLFRHPADDALLNAVSNLTNEQKLELAEVLEKLKNSPGNTATRALRGYVAAAS